MTKYITKKSLVAALIICIFYHLQLVCVIADETYKFDYNTLSDDIDDIDMMQDISNNIAIHDNFEHFNRKIFAFNRRFDVYPVKPLIKVYREVTVTAWSRKRISSFLTNLYEPKNMLDGILYGSPAAFFKSGLRLLINSTVGVAGFFDVAGRIGIEKPNLSLTDVMSKRLCIKNGQYLMIPVLGPSTVRNATGLVLDRLALDPLGFILPFYTTVIRTGLDILIEKDKYADTMQQIHDISIDEYAMLRSVYYQSDGAQECDATYKK